MGKPRLLSSVSWPRRSAAIRGQKHGIGAVRRDVGCNLELGFSSELKLPVLPSTRAFELCVEVEFTMHVLEKVYAA